MASRGLCPEGGGTSQKPPRAFSEVSCAFGRGPENFPGNLGTSPPGSPPSLGRALLQAGPTRGDQRRGHAATAPGLPEALQALSALAVGAAAAHQLSQAATRAPPAVAAAGALRAPLGAAAHRAAPRARAAAGPRGGVPSGDLRARTAVMVWEGPTAGCGSQAEAARCSICFEDFRVGEELRVLPCFHKYHRACVDTWFRQHQDCPVCKHRVL
ncbi:unnamed protein product [Prorocentrum cordatum]|uniref:RING-type domain-containing protein n=1 Tax=Prorocentrum cordatum TaxID=2364126 RepID=A0ABN9Y120_9DINO|nr:unnamed protein product [Polarella glacialis]